MIPVDSLLYKIDQKLNKLSTNEHQQIQLEDKILALNEAQIKLIKQKVDGFSVVNGMGMDAFKKRYEDLQRLVINYNHGKLPLHIKNETLNQWSADIDLLDPKYMFYIDSYVLADKGVCKDRQIWINKDLAKHGDLQFLLNRMLARGDEAVGRVIVDVENFRKEQEAGLLAEIREMVERVRTSGEIVDLPPMNAYERRIIHQAFRDDPQVETVSPESPSRLKRIRVRPRRPAQA